MNIWNLPTSLPVSEVDWDIRAEYPAILDILSAFTDPEYEDDEKWLIALTIFYKDFDRMNESDYPEACKQLVKFIDMGIEESKDVKQSYVLMDWEQDAHLIIPEINKQIGNGIDVRSLPTMHWWTFLGYYMGIGESAFTTIMGIRSKKARGKRLEKWEQDYERENKNIVNLRPKLTAQEQKELEEEREMLKYLF